MNRNRLPLMLTVLLTAACSATPQTKNSTRADGRLEEQIIDGCQPLADSPPRLLAGRAPVYPVHRLLAQEEGYTLLAFDITADGRAENFEKLESTHPKFYVHARVAIQEWKIAPAVQDGAPVKVRCRFRQEFYIRHKRR